MKIGELARRRAVGVDTVRYYEREGLLPPPQRTASGYRQYQDADVARLRFVRAAKQLGFSLTRIRDLQALVDHEDDMAAVESAASSALDDVEHKLAELLRIRDDLRVLVASCPGQGALDACPILNALDEASP